MSSSPTPVEGSEKFDWMADDDASQCVICDKPFGRIKNRRHHCRHCGRLVCGLCSSRKHVLRAGEEPRRVCDDCFDCLTIKQQVKAQAKGKVDREVLLLNTSSKVSDTLVRLYFLDGSFKTLYYDDYTTAAELVAKVCFSVKVALFEVKLDMRDTSEYQLVPADESIMNILSRWTLNNLNFSKLVVPIYDIHSTMKANTIPDSTVTRLSNFVMPSTMPPPPPQQLASQENVAPGIGGISLCGNNSSVIAREGSGSSMNVNSLLSAVSVPPGTPPRRRDRDDESVMTGGTGIRSSFAANSRASLSFKPNNGGSASLLPPSGIMTIQQLIHVDLQAMVSNTYDEDMSDIGSVMGGGGVGHCINIAQEMQATIRQLSEDYNKLRTETDDLKKKHELLKSIQRNRNNTGSVRDSISMRKHASTMMNATPAPVTPVSKANEFLEIYRSEGMSDSEDEDVSCCVYASIFFYGLFRCFMHLTVRVCN